MELKSSYENEVKNGWTDLYDEHQELKKELDKYKKLWNEESQLVEMLQKDKDYMDLKLMRAIELIEIIGFLPTYKEDVINLIKKARARV